MNCSPLLALPFLYRSPTTFFHSLFFPSSFFQELLAHLEILHLSTDKLILHFQTDMVRQQREAKMKLGTLTLSVGYLRDKKAVEVNVVQGQNLPGLDKTGKEGQGLALKFNLQNQHDTREVIIGRERNLHYQCLWHFPPGLSDPFVELHLMPKSSFKDSSEKTFKTQVLKQTLDPVFNDEFLL